MFGAREVFYEGQHFVSFLHNKRPRGLEAFTRTIFFKFSGISLVSMGRVRLGNEIKSK